MAADPRRVKELFVAALELPDPQAWQAFLERECAGDAELRQRLEILLKAHDDPVSALERPLAPVESPIMHPAQERPVGPELGETGCYHDPGEEVGSIIAGKYKLLEALGQGGMGDVFMAQQTAPVKRLVALKLIKPGMDSRQVLARFEAERQALALMDHPNIAKVLDAGATESGRPFFVMELVKGVLITRFCDERQLSPRERLELFIPVCQAIQHAHQKGVIHRDIKPSNVMPRAFYVLFLALALWPSSARAQPLFRFEHNWAFTINEQKYGLRQVREIPGDFRWTQVWLGQCSFNINCRAVTVIGLIIFSPADLIPLIDWRSFRCLS
jgi:hypothetical protein